MIKLYAFGNVHPIVKGYTRDFRIQWALEELGLPYELVGLDHSAGDTQTKSYKDISPFMQIPVIDDDGFVLTESAAILIYLAEKAGKIPTDLKQRTRVIQWCFASLATVELPFVQLLGIDKFGDDKSKRDFTIQWAKRVLSGIEQQLQKADWLTGNEFTVADLLMTTVLRIIRSTDLIEGYPAVKSFYERATAREAYQKTLRAYAERLNVSVEQIS